MNASDLVQIIVLPANLIPADASTLNLRPIATTSSQHCAVTSDAIASSVTIVVASSSDANITISNCAFQPRRVALTTSYPHRIVSSPGQRRTVASNDCLAKDRLANDRITTDNPTAALPCQPCAVITVNRLTPINCLTTANELVTVNGPTIVCHTDNQLAAVNGPIIEQRAPIEPIMASIEPSLAPFQPTTAPNEPMMAPTEPMMAPIEPTMALSP
jgi:hypothetical protein